MCVDNADLGHLPQTIEISAYVVCGGDKEAEFRGVPSNLGYQCGLCTLFTCHSCPPNMAYWLHFTDARN